MNDKVETLDSTSVVEYSGSRLTAAAIREQVNLVQEVMRAVMKGPSKENPSGSHYGVIPGTPKPTLFKPGAEVLCATFRIRPKFVIEDLSTSDCRRYRVTCIGVHQPTGIELADGMGSASSNEEKYKWRRALNEEEFNLTPETQRRVKFAKGQHNSVYKVKQIRAEPDDIDNTVLKIACKRAQVAMTLNATAASDIFIQDIEDLPSELRPESEPSEASATTTQAKTGVEALQARVEALKPVPATPVVATKSDGDDVPVGGAGAFELTPPSIEEQVLTQLREEALNGERALDAAWGGLSKEYRTKLQPHFPALKEAARKVDADQAGDRG
jgi:hypothetical protein